MGVKNSAMKNRKEVVMAVMPVRPPSRMPDALSMNAVHGEEPCTQSHGQSDSCTGMSPARCIKSILRRCIAHSRAEGTRPALGLWQ